MDRVTRDRLIAEHPSSKEVLKPFLRGRDVKRWRVEFAEQYLIRIESSENVEHPWSGKPNTEAERSFAKTYPAIHEFFDTMRKELTKRWDQGKYFWELRSCDYWQEFGHPKVISTKISIQPTFAVDFEGYFLGNTSYFIPTGKKALFVSAILNSSLFFGYAKRVFVEKQGGWYEVQPQGLEAFPIPPATGDQQCQCEWLAEALTWLHRTELANKRGDAPVGLMTAYFERWLNGLVYELFFPGELHARKLNLFDQTAKLDLPNLADVPEKRKLEHLQEAFSKAHDRNATLCGMLSDLKSLDVVRVIEDVSSPAGAEQPESEE